MKAEMDKYRAYQLMRAAFQVYNRIGLARESPSLAFHQRRLAFLQPPILARILSCELAAGEPDFVCEWRHDGDDDGEDVRLPKSLDADLQLQRNTRLLGFPQLWLPD